MQELPSIKFIRKCRTILQIIGEALEGYCIGEVKQWDTLLSDGMGTRQIAFQNLVIVVLNEEHLRPHTLNFRHTVGRDV